jgi:hypothetical protein
MTNSISKCGCICINCPTYRDNITTIEKRRNCSFGWKKYLNIKLNPEKLRACDGCSIDDSERKTYYLNCKLRKCAMINEIDNCAYCTGFPCDEVLKAHSVQKINNRDEFIKKTGKEVSDNDYRIFIEPYTGIYHLNKIRQTLTDKDLKKYKSYSIKAKFAYFDNSNFKQKALEKIYLLLTTICIEKNISYARFQTLENKREQLMKILWAMGYHGILNKDNGIFELDSNTFLSNKIHGMYAMVQEYIKDLKTYDVCCEVVPLVKQGWLTPMGGLRKEGWVFRLEFGDSLDGIKTQRVFNDYIQKLNAKFGNKAYKMFKMADLSIMIKK